MTQLLVRFENASRMGAVRIIDVAFAVVLWLGWLRCALWLIRAGTMILDGLQEEE